MKNKVSTELVYSNIELFTMKKPHDQYQRRLCRSIISVCEWTNGCGTCVVSKSYKTYKVYLVSNETISAWSWDMCNQYN